MGDDERYSIFFGVFLFVDESAGSGCVGYFDDGVLDQLQRISTFEEFLF